MKGPETAPGTETELGGPCYLPVLSDARGATDRRFGGSERGRGPSMMSNRRSILTPLPHFSKQDARCLSTDGPAAECARLPPPRYLRPGEDSESGRRGRK